MFCYHAPYDLPVRSTVVASLSGNVMNFAVARCGKKDSFNRKIGRKIAEGRLNSDKILYSTEVAENANPTTVFIQEAKNITETLINSKRISSEPVFA